MRACCKLANVEFSRQDIFIPGVSFSSCVLLYAPSWGSICFVWFCFPVCVLGLVVKHKHHWCAYHNALLLVAIYGVSISCIINKSVCVCESGRQGDRETGRERERKTEFFSTHIIYPWAPCCCLMFIRTNWSEPLNWNYLNCSRQVSWGSIWPAWIQYGLYFRHKEFRHSRHL